MDVNCQQDGDTKYNFYPEDGDSIFLPYLVIYQNETLISDHHGNLVSPTFING
jgi:hypothetical protein